jgi:hypothetical protein
LKVAYVIIAHQDPQHVARLARLLMADGGRVAIHLDANTGEPGLQRLRHALGEDAARVLWPARRVRVAWGEWSIVEATLLALEAIEVSGEAPDYVQLLSGSDYPIRPLSQFRDYLARTGGDFIECYDMAREPWIKGGLTHERWRYRHVVNERRRPRLFGASWRAQQLLGLARSFPKGLAPHVGAQWWTLSWETCRMVLAAGRDPALRSFFRYVWIPDEMFIQTVVAARVPADRRRRTCLTLFQFTDYGVPVVYANDHADHLSRQPFFFARKISRSADRLREELDRIVRGERPVTPAADGDIGRRTGEYERAVRGSRLPRPGRRVIGQDVDRWRGDLGWSNTPFVAVLGMSRQELGLVQQVLAASGRIECHGALFDPSEVDFAGFRPSFAGYGRTDTALRDARPTTFLVDVLTASAPATVGFLLPWRQEDEMRDKVLWHAKAQIVLVRGNLFRAFLEQEAAKAAVPRPMARWVSAADFGAFCIEAERYHAHVLETAAEAGITFSDISLLEPGWWQRLQDVAACAAPPAGHGNVSPIAPIGEEQAMRLLAELPDPSRQITNIRALTEVRVPMDVRPAHLALLARPAAPVKGGTSQRDVVMREPVG